MPLVLSVLVAALSLVFVRITRRLALLFHRVNASFLLGAQPVGQGAGRLA